MCRSDWSGTYSVDESIKAGLDLEMPGPPFMRTAATVSRMLQAGKLTVEDLDERVRNARRSLLSIPSCADLLFPLHSYSTSSTTPLEAAFPSKPKKTRSTLLKFEHSFE
jgi:hypothetical protein